MTEPYLIALDLDGTLLNNRKEISLRTKQVLKKCESLGHKLVISTGRPFRASKRYYEELDLDTPIVNFNGAHVHHPRSSDFGTHHTSIPKETALKIVQTCRSFNIKNVMTEILDEVYIDQFDQELIKAFDMDQSGIIFGPIDQTLNQDPTCVLVKTAREDVEQLMDTLDSEHAEIVEQRSWGFPSDIIEIIRRGTNKATGLERVAAYLSIPTERILAFGDEENDLEMLQEAGIGIAMGNASDFIKETANHITLTNEQEGVAFFLEQFFNLSFNKPCF